MLTKLIHVESSYFRVNVGILMKIAKKMENFRYIIVSSLYIVNLLLFRSLRYILST